MRKSKKHAKVPSLGFRFSDAEERAMQRAIASAVAFMETYGKGQTQRRYFKDMRYYE